jgi:hypothetical protein
MSVGPYVMIATIVAAFAAVGILYVTSDRPEQANVREVTIDVPGPTFVIALMSGSSCTR